MRNANLCGLLAKGDRIGGEDRNEYYVNNTELPTYMHNFLFYLYAIRPNKSLFLGDVRCLLLSSIS